MKKINKKLMVILLSGFVLMTGCKNINTISPKDVASKTTSEEAPITSDKPEIIQSNKEVKPTEIAAETSTQNDLTESQTPEEKITNYVNGINNSIDSESIKENAIKKFIILTDFIFYDTEINGIKFNDLKDSTKKEILDIYFTIDSKIETKFPDYKESIADKYNIATNYLKNKYVEISDKVKEKTVEKIGQDNYNNISETNKEITEQDKENLQIMKEKVEETTDKAKTKVKNWYEDLKK